MGCFKSNALALRHSHRSPRNESDSGRLFGYLAAFKFAIGASFKKPQSDSFQNGFVPHPILLFQKMRGWLRAALGITSRSNCNRFGASSTDKMVLPVTFAPGR